MPEDSVKTCPRCNKRDITSFSKCRFCGSRYNSSNDSSSETEVRKIGLGSLLFFVILAILIVYGLNCAYQSFYPTLYENFFHSTAAEQADMPSELPSLLSPPVQVMLAAPQSFTLKGYTITKVASYRVTARVIATSYNWWLDSLNHISRVDLALGWSLMADKRVLQQISIWHHRRHLGWSFSHNIYDSNKQLIEPSEIFCNSANTHIIPADDHIEKVIESLHRNQVVTLTGFLVNIGKSDSLGGSFWNTSLTRDDTGDGACEIMYVENVEIH